MGKLADYLIQKAVRDRSRLVQVQRTVSRGGKTFIQNYWVAPSAVKPTDRVIGNQHLLQQVASKAPQPTQNTGTAFDKAHFDSLAATDRAQAMAYLNQCGITWKTNAHAGINWMRAMQAAKKAGSTAQSSATQVSVQPANGTTQSAQTTQSNANIQIDSKLQSELDACATSKDKVILLKKKLGPAGCMDFAKKLGVTWTENAHAGINQMRMSMALQKWFDANSSLAGNVGAPVGNQNAKKDGTTASPQPSTKDKKPKVGPDLVPVPKGATTRQKNLIELVNKIDDADELAKFRAVGMLPEDDLSKSYILNKLAPKYMAWKGTKGGGEYPNEKYNLAWFIMDNTKPKGCQKEGVLDYGFDRWYSSFATTQISNPRNHLNIFQEERGDTSFPNINSIVYTLYQDFSTFASDKYVGYKTNLGYSGWNLDECEKQYDKEKDGFWRALNKIQKMEPSVKGTVGEMMNTYEEMMSKVGHHAGLLNVVLSDPDWETDTFWSGISGSFEAEARNPSEAKYQIEKFEENANKLVVLFQNHGLTNQDIVDTLCFNARTGIGYDNFHLYKKGTPAEILDLSESMGMIDAVSIISNLPLLYNKFSMKYGKRCDKTWPSFRGDIKKQKTAYLRAEAIASISKDTHDEIVDLAIKLFGTSMWKHYKGAPIKISSKDLASVKHRDDIVLISDVSNDDRDFVCTNLIMMYNSCQINRRILGHTFYAKPSKNNDRGKDYSKSFSYYTPYNMYTDGNMTSVRKNSYNKYTADFQNENQLNQVVQMQLGKAPFLSKDYVMGIKHSDSKLRTSNGFENGYGSDKLSLDTLVQSPLKDVIFEITKNIYSQIPAMDTIELHSQLSKKLRYQPYDFSASVQTAPGKKANSKSSNKTDIRKAREDTLKAVHCSIMAEDEKTSEAMRKDFLDRWDYDNSGTQKCPDGIARKTTYTKGNTFNNGDRRVLFNSRFFRVKNSNMEEDYDNYKEELSGHTDIASSTQEMDLFSAMSYASCAGILGATGGWDMKGKLTKVATAMGNGAYFGYRGGKSVPYCGEVAGGYGGTSKKGKERDNANGCYILANVIRGKSGDSTSDHGRFHDFEICVHTNKVIKPHHFVDVSVRTMGVNAERDKDGNYMSDDSGQVTHDKNGMAVDKKYI